jgi:Spy/CpxP family protein refolding chaperone
MTVMRKRSNLTTLAALLLGAMVSSFAWALHARTLPLSSESMEGFVAPDAGEWFLGEVVESLDLSEEQQATVEGIRSRNAARIRRMEAALASTRSAIRSVEEADVFDEAMAGNLILREAEVAGYLWGTRTRITAEVYRVLTPEQRVSFRDLRSRDELRREHSEWRDRWDR